MLIFHANDSRNSLVFMHVPKCAGAAIQTYLQNHLKKRRGGRMQVLWGVRHEVDVAHLTLATAPRHVDWARVKRERYYAITRWRLFATLTIACSALLRGKRSGRVSRTTWQTRFSGCEK